MAESKASSSSGGGRHIDDDDLEVPFEDEVLLHYTGTRVNTLNSMNLHIILYYL